MTLNILFSTIDNGINKISEILLPLRSDVKYIVSHQYQNEKLKYIPKELFREDVFVSQIPGKGVTKSRNNAIKLATGDICVIADDDVKYTKSYFDTILNTYQSNDVDVACFKIFTGEKQKEYKNYPEVEKEIRNLVGYSSSAIEITFKLEIIKKENILFDERFGLGSWLNGGGENVFIHDSIKKGLKVRFFPYFIVQHPFESTIKSFPKYSQRRIRVTGAIDARFNGYYSIPKACAATFKYLPDILINKKNPIIYLTERLSGAFYILKSN